MNKLVVLNNNNNNNNNNNLYIFQASQTQFTLLCTHTRVIKQPSNQHTNPNSFFFFQFKLQFHSICNNTQFQFNSMGNINPKLKQPDSQPEHPQPDPSLPFTCEICIEPILHPNTKFTNSNKCVHPFCTDCMIKYIQVKLQDNVCDIKCPAVGCEHLLEALSCREKIARQVFDKWCDVLCEKTVLGFDRVYCPNRECSVLVVNECGNGGSLKKCVCPNCKKQFCFRCKVPWHAGYRCEESGEMRDQNDIAFGVLSERKQWMRCPTCRHCVELVKGCAIVRCRCGIEFCYKCGKKVDHHWCNCRRSSTICMWVFHLCIVMLVVWPFFLLFTAITRKNQHH